MNKLTCRLLALLFLSTEVYAQVEAPQSPESPRVPKTVSKTTTNRVTISYSDEKIQDEDGPMKAKNLSKSFILNNSDKVSLSNQYGNITIKTWDRKEIKIDVDIKAYSNREDDAQKLLDEVNVEAGKNGDIVAVKTVMENRNGNYGSSSKNGRFTWRREVRVNYIVYMPATIALTASQQYGNILMENFSAPTSLKVQYGNLVAGKLTNANNYISVQYGKTNVDEVNGAIIKQQYGSGLTIGVANSLELSVQYAAANISTIKGNAEIKVQYGNGLTLGSVTNLELTVQYAKAKISNISGSASLNHQYGSLEIGTVGRLNLKAQYSGVSIGTLRDDANISIGYNNLNIGQVAVGNKNLNVNSRYTAVSIGFASGYNAGLEVNTSYAQFRYGADVTVRRVVEDDEKDYSSKKNYEGKIGNGGSANVKVSASYGSLTFK